MWILSLQTQKQLYEPEDSEGTCTINVDNYSSFLPAVVIT